MKSLASLDPRTKFFLVACLSSLGVLLSDLRILCGLFALCLLLLLGFQISPTQLFQRTKALLGVVLAIAVLQSVFTPGGEALLTLGRISLLSTGGLVLSGEFILRILIIVASAGFLSTSDSRELIQGLIQWKLPYELAFMTAMAVRFLPVFAQEFRDAFAAIQLRGIDLHHLPFRQKMEVYAGLFQPVAGGALLKAKALALSIEMRGFRACEKRSSLLVLRFSLKDYLVMSLAAVFTVAALLYYLLYLG